MLHIILVPRNNKFVAKNLPKRTKALKPETKNTGE